MKPEQIILREIKKGLFKIDMGGRVWRLKRKHWCRAEHRTPLGYLQVRKMISGKRYHVSVHRVVWCFFNNKPIPEGMIINHKNGVKDDNRPENLEVVTYSENLKHAHQEGLVDQFGEKNPAAKLSNRQVAEIRLIYAEGGYTQMELGKKYGVTFQTISDIVRGKYRTKQGGRIGDYSHRRKNGNQRDPKTGRFL